MKTAAKAFIYFGFGVRVIVSLIFVNTLSNLIPITNVLIATVLSFIIMYLPSIIIGVLALNQINDYYKPSIAVSILTLLFCNFIAGALMLCIEDRGRAGVDDRAREIKYKYIIKDKRGKICEECGQTRAGSRYYTTQSSLGEVSRFLCLYCKAAIDLQNRSNKTSPTT